MAEDTEIKIVDRPAPDRGVLCPKLNEAVLTTLNRPEKAALFDITKYRQPGKTAQHTRMRLQRSVRDWLKSKGKEAQVNARPTGNENFVVFWLTPLRKRTRKKETAEGQEI
jgi:hypothetical protein